MRQRIESGWESKATAGEPCLEFARMLGVLLVGVLTLGLVGCGGQGAQNASTLENSSSEVPEVVPLAGPANGATYAPEITATSDGGVILSWLEVVAAEDRHRARLLWSRLGDEGWGAVGEIPIGQKLFANWADRPHVTDLGANALLAHWLEMVGDGTYTYGIALAHSAGGEGWTPAGWLHDDLSPNEHGFASWVSDGETLWAVWLDGRSMGEGEPMQLRALALDPAAPRGEAPERAATILDSRVCECCDTDAVLGADGPVVAYRDRSEDEVRNIGVVRYTEAGWSEPTTIHDDGWTIHGCPVNGPALAADGTRVAVAWYTLGDDQVPRVRLAVSDDGGARFGAPIEVAVGDGDGAVPLGRVDLELDGAGNAWVLWLDQRSEERAEVRLRSVGPEGTLAAPVVVAETAPSRAAGVPRLGRVDDRLVVAWVATGGELGDSREVRTAWLEVGG